MTFWLYTGGIIAGGISGLLIYLAWWSGQADADAATSSIITNQDANTGNIIAQQTEGKREILGHQTEVKEGITKGIEESTRTIVEGQDSMRADLLDAIKNAPQSLKDKLWLKYPSGYVLFAGEDAETICKPVYRGDLTAEADWETATVHLNRAEKKFVVYLPNPKWKQSSTHQIDVNLTGVWPRSGKYEIGTSTSIELVVVAGQPQMYFEVIDDDAQRPLSVVGFK